MKGTLKRRDKRVPNCLCPAPKEQKGSRTLNFSRAKRRGWNRIALRQVLAYEHSYRTLEKLGRPGSRWKVPAAAMPAGLGSQRCISDGAWRKRPPENRHQAYGRGIGRRHATFPLVWPRETLSSPLDSAVRMRTLPD